MFKNTNIFHLILTSIFTFCAGTLLEWQIKEFFSFYFLIIAVRSSEFIFDNEDD